MSGGASLPVRSVRTACSVVEVIRKAQLAGRAQGRAEEAGPEEEAGSARRRAEAQPQPTIDLGGQSPPTMKWGDDIGGDEETIVASAYDRPVMVHRYPAEMKAFYFKKDPQDPKVALGCDVLAPEGYGEIIGGGQREDDLAVLEAAIAHHKLPAEAFQWYLDLRRYGTVPRRVRHGGERCVAWICGLHHVRETIPFARMTERITP